MTRRLIGHSLRAVAQHKLRSAFLMLGSFVGVAVLALVLSIGDGADRKVQETVRRRFGAASIAVNSGGGRHMGGPRPDAPRLTLDDLEAVAAEVPDVDAWDPQQAAPEAVVRWGDATAVTAVQGQSERAERVVDRGVIRGEWFDAAAVADLARVAVIGETVERELFAGAEPLGAEILVDSASFRVIGILEPFGCDAHGMDLDDVVVVPISTVMRRILNVDTIYAARVRVRDPGLIEETAEQVRDVLRRRHGLTGGQADDFTVITPVQVRQMVARVRGVFFVLLPLVAVVALAGGGAVAAAIMLAAVKARTREIGLRRAVGARPRDILAQFLLETSVTQLGGGLAGLVVGSAGAQLLANVMRLGNVLSWKAALLGIVLSAGVGVLAGLVPARRAARLDPAEALRCDSAAA